ncbi:MAG TPA: GNAT family N-acetyltransferase [Mycobacteriales bacterium]|jgi:RimJ/RimL family protein N-acetyltransferase|nr:GNAT family N-acetyltransferase [Mycobacteriales bacterium]
MTPANAPLGDWGGPLYYWQPTLEGSLVWLRPIKTSDFDALYAIASDPLLWEQHPVKNRTDRAVFQSWFDDALTSQALVVIERSTGLAIGTSRYEVRDRRRRHVEIGWTFISRSHWGGAYNSDVKRLMIDHAFGWARVVTLKVHESNLRSLRAIEKLGAERVRLEPARHGVGSSVVYELTPATWSAHCSETKLAPRRSK